MPSDMCGWCKGDLVELGRWNNFDYCSKECYESYWQTVFAMDRVSI